MIIRISCCLSRIVAVGEVASIPDAAFRFVISAFRVVPLGTLAFSYSSSGEREREGKRKIPALLSALFAEPARISDLFVPFSRYEYRAVRFGSPSFSLSPALSIPFLPPPVISLSLSLSLSSPLQLLARSFVIRRTLRDAFENLALELSRSLL